MTQQMPITNNSGTPSFGSGSPLLGGMSNLANLMRLRALMGNAGGGAANQVSPKAPIFPGAAQPPPVLSNQPLAIPRGMQVQPRPMGAVGGMPMQQPPVSTALGQPPQMPQAQSQQLNPREDKMLILKTMADYLDKIGEQEHAERGIVK